METLQRLHNRGSISTDTGYAIDNSLKFEADNSEYLNRTSGANGSRTTWTTSVWVKRTELGVNQAVFSSVNSGAQTNFFRFLDSDKIRFYFQPDDVGATYYADTNAVFRDTSAWYHIVWGLDSTNSDGSKRFVVYVNGVYQDSTWAGSATASTNCPQNSGSRFLQSEPIQIGKGTYGADHYFNGYMAELHVLDGTAPDPTDFGEFDEDSGIWKPIEVDVTYGTQGFYLDFADAADLGDDESGNGNDFTENNITSADQATDTPTNNFSTLNPLIEQALVPTKYTVTQGGTKQVSAVDGYGCSVGTIGVSKGKWYFEAQFNSDGSGKHFGVIDEASFTTGTAFVDGISPGQQAYGVSIFKNGGINVDGSYDSSYSFSSFTTETLGCAMDLDNNKLYFSRSGTYGNSGDPTSGATGTGAIPLSTAGRGTWFISTACYNGYAQTNQGGYTSYTISSAASDANGYGTFEYAPPSGYYALCTKNLEVYG